MTSDNKTLRVKINSFIRRKETKYPELAKSIMHEPAYSDGFHEDIDSRPYILVGS